MRYSHLLALLGAASAAHATITDGTWEELAEIPLYPRQEDTGVVLNETTFAILGGVIPYSPQNLTVGNTTSIMQFYDVPSNTWTRGPDIPLARNHVNAVGYKNRAYIVGALQALNSSYWAGDGASYEWDPETNAWTNLTVLPAGTERGAALTVAHEGVIWVVGGVVSLIPGPGNPHHTVANVSAFNLTSRSWVELPAGAANLPEPRDHATGGVAGGRLWLAGGRINGQVNMRGTVYSLDLSDVGAGWATHAGSDMPTPRGGAMFAMVDGLLWTLGGERNVSSETGIFDQVEVFNTTDETWTRLSPMKVPRHGFIPAYINGSLYLPGGATHSGEYPTTYHDRYILPPL